jgi:hypothetical protein
MFNYLLVSQHKDQIANVVKQLAYALSFLLYSYKSKVIALEFLASSAELTKDLVPDAWFKKIADEIVYPVTIIPPETIEMASKITEDNIGKLEESLARDFKTQASLQAELKRCEERIARTELELMINRIEKRNKDKIIERAKNSVAAALTSVYVKALHLVGNHLILNTRNVEIMIPGGLVFDVGRLLVDIPIKGSVHDIKFWNMDRRPNGSSVPHAFTNQSVCWGNAEDWMNKAMKQGDVVTIINGIIGHATSVNINDGLGMHVVDWPLSPNSRKKRLTNEEKNEILSLRYQTEDLANVITIEEEDQNAGTIEG